MFMRIIKEHLIDITDKSIHKYCVGRNVEKIPLININIYVTLAFPGGEIS